MVRDSEDILKEDLMVPKSSTSALMRRAEQLKRWEESETNRVVPAPVNTLPRRVRFPEQYVFLAACSCGDLEEVAALLEKGADVNTKNADGMTALHQAVIDENFEMVEYLLEHGAEIDAQDNEGWSPLMAGVSCNFLDIVRCLLQTGADPVLCNSDGELPVDLAETDEMRTILHQEIRNRGISLEDARTREENQMLEDAIAWSKSARITKEYRHPVTGATPTHVAAAKGYCKVLRILLQAGADVNAKDVDGWAPMHAAAHWGEREACEVLADHNANMDIQNNMGSTCLDVADEEIVQFLEELKEKRKKINAANLKRISNSQQHQTSSFSSSSAAVTSSSSEPVTPLSPTIPLSSLQQQPQLPAWRLTGRRAASTSSLPPQDQANQVQNQPDQLQNARSALQDQDQGASPAKKRADSTTTTSSANSAPPADDKNRSTNFTGNGSRGEESESERKLRARRERESRRSTQGITLETIRAAESVTLNRKRTTTPDTQEQTDLLSSKENSGQSESTMMTSSSSNNNNEQISKHAASLARLSANLNSTLRNLDEFTNTSSTTSTIVTTVNREKDKFSAKFIPPLIVKENCIDEPKKVMTTLNNQPENKNVVGVKASVSSISSTTVPSSKSGSAAVVVEPSSSSSAATTRAARRARGTRRSTGPIAQDDVHLAAGDAATLAPPNSSDNNRLDPSAPDRDHINNDSAKNGTTTKKSENDKIVASLTSKLLDDPHSQHRFISKPIFAYMNLSDYRNNRQPGGYLSGNSAAANQQSSANSNGANADRFSRTSSGVSVSNSSSSSSTSSSGSAAAPGGQDLDIDYKKLYEREAGENERLRKVISDMEKSVDNLKLNPKQLPASGDGTHVLPYNGRLEQLVAKLEEENRTLDQIKSDNIRLKEENGALIRVISKLSKTK